LQNVDPAANDGSVLRIAAWLDVDFVRLLLQHNKANPAARNNAAIGNAISPAMVSLLIKDIRVDVSVGNN